MTVDVIIVNFFTESLLQPLVQQVVGFPAVSQVVVFDNGSATPLSWTEGPVRIMSTGRNLGFGAAVNRAFAATSADHILLLNPDVRIGAASLDRLLLAAQSYRCPLVGPRYYWDDERLFRLPPATGALPWLAVGAGEPHTLEGSLRSQAWAIYHDHHWAQQSPFRLPFLPGACLLLSRDWLMARGRVFDERFFLYFEDTDLCMDALAQGWQPLCVPGAEVIHYWNQSREPEKGKSELMAEAGRLFHQKHATRVWGVTSPSPGLAPPIPRPASEDLGLLHIAPRLSLTSPWPRATLEVAVGGDFVPFAQARLGPEGLTPWCYRDPGAGDLGPAVKASPEGGDALQFPPSVWGRMRAGHYHLRVRGADGRGMKQWRFCLA
jgi:GT2 family glycosyltransferase